MRRLLLLLILLSATHLTYAQGVTTSSMKGKIVDENSEALIGATITARHEPTGSFYGTVTDEIGNYRMDNLKVGGPYTVSVTYVGQEDVVMKNVYLRLGEPFRNDITMGSADAMLNEIVVTERVGSVGKNSGTSTQISADDIDAMPTLNRNLEDFARLTPQANLSTSEGISFGGVNNRFNAIYIDGAVNNDVFGLAGSGTNGGQTGISPFSIDIIDQLQVVLSPYDVTYGGFAGGGINAVTKSGTNQLSGTAYVFHQNQSLVAKENKTFTEKLGIDDADRSQVDDFSKTTYGFSLGGPIVKDKVHFFANVEIQNDETPLPFNIEEYTNENVDRAGTNELNALSTFLQNNYGYDPGGFGSTSDELKGVKLFGKLDFNLNESNKLTLRHQYTKAEQFNRNSSSSSSINFENNGIFFPSITNSTAIELNTMFGNKMSNNLIIGFTDVNDDRDPLGDPFPYVQIDDADNGRIIFGSERFSTANVLTQKIYTLTNNFKIYKGNHTFTIGTHNEFYNIRNVFLPYNYSQYRFANLDAFYNGEASTFHQRVYSLVDNQVGDDTQAAADFSAMQLGIYVQDELNVNDKLTLTGGIRLDVPILVDDPVEAPRFNDEILPGMLAEYPEFDGNVEAGAAPDGQLMFSPRLGFNYDVTKVSTLRGGIGVFTSRIPFVWPGAMYNNNGLTSTYVRAGWVSDDPVFIADINNQYQFDETTLPSGDLNLFTKDFKYPQVLRANLGYDFSIGTGWAASVEGSFTKTLNNVAYTNINTSAGIDFTMTGTGDDRPVFTGDQLDGEEQVNAVYVGSNTNEGYGYNLTASVAKEILTGLDFQLAYNYTDSYALFEGTSSQNSSQWRGSVHVDGRNNPEFGRSDFATGSRVIAGLDYQIPWLDKFGTRISLFYNGQNGIAYSYVIDGGDAENLNNEQGSTSRNRSLVYVPNGQNDINLIDYEEGDATVTAAQQWTNLNSFIEDDAHLSERRGDYAEKNGARAPWVNFIDLGIKQDFIVSAGGKDHKLQASFDIFNVANLINPSWGVRYGIPGDFNNYNLLSFEGYAADGTTPQYTYRNDELGTDAFDIDDLSSRWSARIGLRYIFN